MSAIQNRLEEIPIGVFCQTGSGGTPSRSKASRYFGGSIPWVKSGELRETVITETEEYITKEGLEESAAKILPVNTLLVALYGATVGRIGVLGVEAATNQAVCYIIPDESRADRKYLYYALQSKVPVWLSQRVGGGQPNISQGIIKDTKIPLPPLPEQKRIADILDKADAIRRKRQEVIDLSQDILRSAYLHCFGDPIANPQSWPMKELGELADMVTGFAFKSSEYVGEGVRLCRGANVLPEQIDWSDVRYWRVEDSTVDDKLKLEEGDVVLAMDRPWISSGIKVAQLTESDLPAYLVQRVTRLRGIGHVSNAFLYYTIRHPAFTAHCGGLKTETTVPHISSADIKSFRVPVAPRHIHETFEALANSTQTGFQRLRRAANEATSLFNSLVQLAFKGEL